MAITLDLPTELEAWLRQEAAREGADPSDYVHGILRRQFVARELEALKQRRPARSLADLQPRIPSPPGTNGLAAIAGQWPGDETDEEICQMLEKMS